MTPTLLLLLFLTASTSFISAQSIQSNITLGPSLSTNASFWSSSSGRFNFGFYPERNGFKVGIWLTGISEITVVWTARRDDPPVSNGATLLFTDDGRLLLPTADGQLTPISNTSGPASSASLLDSGNFVLYNVTSHIIWESFDYPTDTILTGQRLLNGNGLYSSANKNDHSTGRFLLAMQPDGNLVQYQFSVSDTAYWATDTSQLGSSISLKLHEEGYLSLLNSSGSSVKNLTEATISGDLSLIYAATLDVDGIFRLYSHSRTKTNITWSSISDPCLLGRFCGYNTYCALMEKEPTCHCAPGFDFVNPELQFQGCNASFTEQDCSGNEGNLTYSISVLGNTTWVDTSYMKLPSANEEGCKQVCMADCTCQMATFKDGLCSKFFTPFKYGRKGSNDSTKSFIKVGSYNGSVPREEFVPSQRKLGKSYRMLFMIGMVFASCLVVLVAFSVLQMMVDRSRILRCRDFLAYRVTDDVSLRSFTYKDLNEATNGFREVLGKGSFGAVYRGTLFGDVNIAVKKLDKLREEGERQFKTEMNVIGKTHHRNLIRLLGYCNDDSHRLLVYEFMCDGSLADLLFKGERKPKWEDRVRISTEIAMGLFYLHEECDTQIIHCDIKPQNILLDDCWFAKISDSGLAKLLDTDQTRTLTGARGTRGYVAPEWNRHVPINAKVDVYSFGVMLLEIICCRKSLMARVPENQFLLSDWVYECFAGGNLQNLIAPEELESRTEKRRLERMVMVGLWCIQEIPLLRPSMKRVVLMLEGMVDIQAPPHPIAPIVVGNLMDLQQS